VIFDPDTLPAARFNSAIAAAGPSVGMTVTFAPVHDDAGIEEAIGAQAREPGGSLIVMPGGFTVTHLGAIIAAAARHRLPLIGAYGVTGSGGLMSYWYDAVEAYARAASYIDRILKGANPADLPVQQPT
jgi:putative ABC transport system substrate-binding protein